MLLNIRRELIIADRNGSVILFGNRVRTGFNLVTPVFWNGSDNLP